MCYNERKGRRVANVTKSGDDALKEYSRLTFFIVEGEVLVAVLEPLLERWDSVGVLELSECVNNV